MFDRLEKANQACRLLGRTLHCSSVSFRIRLMLYRATVLGALLSGLEDAVLTRDHVRGLRRLLLGRAYSLSNSQVRAHTRSPTITSLLRARRVQWTRKMIHNPIDYLPVLAATTGKSLSMTTPPLAPQGIPTITATPWLSL
eukprot:3260404-Heterocapsa_arctica.AAC.1